VTSRLGTGKTITFFTVHARICCTSKPGFFRNLTLFSQTGKQRRAVCLDFPTLCPNPKNILLTEEANPKCRPAALFSKVNRETIRRSRLYNDKSIQIKYVSNFRLLDWPHLISNILIATIGLYKNRR
jgi:hypothetical protein